MNLTLPRTPIAVRINAVVAALVVTLTLIASIDQLAESPSAPLMAATATQAAA